MRRRVWIVGGVSLTMLAVAVSAAAAYAYVWDHDRADTIAKGVTIAGIDVGGLRAHAAEALVAARVSAHLRSPVRLVRGDHVFVIRPSRAGVRVEVARMVADAVAASRRGSLWHRVVRAIRGTRVDVDIPLRAGVSQAHVARVVRGVARVLDRRPTDARLVPTGLATGIRVVKSRWGLAVDRPKLTALLTQSLIDLDGKTELTVPIDPLKPRLGLRGLERRYGTYILVSRETFTLRLYKRLKLVKTYHVAVGMQGLETPAGQYEINDKQIDPSWHVPLSPWAGDLAGRVIPPGPDDPIKARWMGFFDGAGIHGTDEISSIGSAASHGCIRMTIPDVEDLYPRVPLHTPIYVG
ncbi:MAG TPA: L,D-transpeptidase family protein [Gaiellaceae bacterium]|nr:L,D-transpeptidase family protein [Gaiellaceae bacterium]